jgi:hypothetical protein
VGDLATRAEVLKLSAELDIDPLSLAFLEQIDAAGVAALRRTISRARFARIEPRLRRLAATSTMLPMGATAKIARTMLGASLCGKVAGLLEVPTAVRFAGHYDPPFLAELATAIDPERTASVIAAIDPELAMAVSLELLRREEFLTLGRLVSAAPADLVTGLVEQAEPIELLHLAYFTDDHQRLDEIIGDRPDELLVRLVAGAAPVHVDRALSVITFVGPANRIRFGAAVESADLQEIYRAAAVRLGVEIAELPAR